MKNELLQGEKIIENERFFLMYNKELNFYVSKYYPRLLNYCRFRIKYVCIRDEAEDILQDAMLSLCLMQKKQIEKLLYDERHGSPHLFNFIRMKVTQRIKDAIRGNKPIFELADTDTLKRRPLYYEGLSEEQYAKFRAISCNIRPDDFISPLEHEVYVPIKCGWVGGWVHSDIKKSGIKYTYWYYSAFVGSRSKGDIPKRIKTSASKHEAYMGLVDYNRKQRVEYEKKQLEIHCAKK